MTTVILNPQLYDGADAESAVAAKLGCFILNLHIYVACYF